MKNLLNEPIVRFLGIGFLLYLSWLGIYEWWIHPHQAVDRAVINNTMSLSSSLLRWMGYEVAMNGERLLVVKGTPGLFIGDSCNGVSLFAVYSIFIIAFPGNIFSKFIFIPAGILAIHFLNVFRVVALAVIETYSYHWTEFNHTYTFTILIYAFILAAWLFWIRKFSRYKKQVPPDS